MEAYTVRLPKSYCGDMPKNVLLIFGWLLSVLYTAMVSSDTV